MNNQESLIQLLNGKTISSARSAYRCTVANETIILFALSENTNKVMLPTDLVLEWISAYETGVITLNDKARDMRDKITPRSSWAKYQHGFETHLFAIVSAWAEKYPPKSK